MPQVKAYGPLAMRVGDNAVRGEGATVAEVIVSVDKQFPGFRSDVFRPDMTLRSSIAIYIGDRDVDPDASVADDDLIEVMAAVAGG
jgi:molybdopterin converting factor small subunit